MATLLTDENANPAPSDQVERRPKRVYRVISDTARMNLSLDFAFLVERERWLTDEKTRLRRKFQQLNKEIDIEIAQCREEQDRLMAGIRYAVIAEEIPDAVQQRAAAPTSLIVSEDPPEGN